MPVDPASLIRAIHGLWRRLAGDRRGNVLMITGLAILPLTIATGMGIDYSRAMRLQTKLNAVADAAALSAVTQPMMNQNMLNACDVARRNFVTQADGLDGLTLDTGDPDGLTITVSDTFASLSPVTITCPKGGIKIPVPTALPLSRVTTVTYKGQSANAFVGVLGIASLTVDGTTTTRTKLAPYVDIHVALDTSQSMGLAASDAEAARLWNLTVLKNKRGCQFGCHAAATGAGDKYVNSTLAADNGIKLRIDVLKEATHRMIQSAITNQGAQSLYQFGLYRIGYILGDTFEVMQPLTSDLATAMAKADTLSLAANDLSGVGDTDLRQATDSIFPEIKVHGDGTRRDQASAFLFIVTDGVFDTKGACTSGHCTGPIDPTTCQRYKDAGITVGVVYTTYLPILANPTNGSTTLEGNYKALVQPFANQIAPKLQACASTGWFFEASDGAAIDTAMQKLFAQATQTASITH